MLKPDLQHQFWVTKKAVQRKLGSKEDECIVSSDAELDSKIDLLKSIGESCTQLKRILDNYQEKVYILAQEETALGCFLRESGKCSATSNRVMCCAGKSISYSGQQHMKLRLPLVRLQHEVDTFTGRAIKDTYATVQAMERERTEYRAALGWMKAASSQLDPDKGRGLDKFRNAQMYVRTAKTKFDTMTLDCLQKIDLLAAARCNLFSHALVAYQAALLDYATKTSYTFKAASKILEEKTHYNFTILKDLTQVTTTQDATATSDMEPIDLDQMLFFKEEYEDEKKPKTTSNNTSLVQQNEPKTKDQKEAHITKSGTGKTADSNAKDKKQPLQTDSLDLLDISIGNNDQTSDFLLDYFEDQIKDELPGSSATPMKTNNFNSFASSLSFDIFKKIQGASAATMPSTSNASQNKSSVSNKSKIGDKKSSAWLDLFADLDPLANPTAMEKKISGKNQNCLDA